MKNKRFNVKFFYLKINELKKDYLFQNFISKDTKTYGFSVGLDKGMKFTVFTKANLSENDIWDKIRLLSMTLRFFYNDKDSTCIDKIPNYLNDKGLNNPEINNKIGILNEKKKQFYNKMHFSTDIPNSKNGTIQITSNGLSNKNLMEYYFNGMFFHPDENYIDYLNKEIEIAGESITQFNAVNLFQSLSDYSLIVISYYDLLNEIITI